MAFQATFRGAGKALPTTANLKIALRSANEPDYTKRDTRELQAMIAALPEADPDVLADMSTRRNNILGYDFTVEAPAPLGETSAPDVEIQRGGEILSRYRASGLHAEHGTLMNGIFDGAVAVDLLWTPGTTGHQVAEYTVVDGVELKSDPNVSLRWAKYVYTGDQFSLAPYTDAGAVILATYNPLRGMNSGYEGGLLRSIIYLSLMKYYARYDWAAVNEKWGNPPVIVTYPRNVSSQKEQVDAVLAWANELATSKGASMPEDIKTSVLDLKNLGVNVDSFQNFMEVIRSAQSRIILGNDVANIAHATGSYAAAKEASKSTVTHNWHDIFWLENILDQYVRADYRLNYGEPPNGLFPRFRFITDEGEDFAQNAITVETLTAAGFDLDPDEVSRKTGFTVTGQRPKLPATQGV